MINNDKENLVNSDYAAKLLVQNLNSLVKSSDPLLATTALEVLQQAIEAERKLKELLILVGQS